MWSSCVRVRQNAICVKILDGGYLMRAKVLVLAAALGVVMTVPVVAHHSFGSEYDEKKPLKFENVIVTKLEWTNPHARFYVDVKDQNGNVANWNLELASRNLEGVKLVAPHALQPYDLLKHDHLLLSKDAAVRLATTLGPRTGALAPEIVTIAPAQTVETPKAAKPAAKKKAAPAKKASAKKPTAKKDKGKK